MSKMRLKKGDRVRVISGKDKGKEGKILVSFPAENKVIVEGVSVASRHSKPTQANPQGGQGFDPSQYQQGPQGGQPGGQDYYDADYTVVDARSAWPKSPAKLSISTRSNRGGKQ